MGLTAKGRREPFKGMKCACSISYTCKIGEFHFVSYTQSLPTLRANIYSEIKELKK
jgi:hypothetical protein